MVLGVGVSHLVENSRENHERVSELESYLADNVVSKYSTGYIVDTDIFAIIDWRMAWLLL
jgi:hypothetical protein